MNICLIGLGIPSLIFANILAKKNIKISILDEEKTQNKFSNRTIGITKTNISYLKKENIIIGDYAWKIKNIKIFVEQRDKKELLNFGPLNDQLFSVIKNSDFKNLLRKKTKKNKLIKIIKLKKLSFYESIIKNKSKFDLIINFNQHNRISKKIFFQRDKKDYNSLAYTCSIKHKKCDNNVAYQIFTKNGPIAFLPCSRSETSIVYSFIKQNNQTTDKKIFNLIEKYNRKYSIESFSKLEKFELKGSHLKNYFYKNILCFGDNIHQIHPLAGQGLNMTIRDMKILSDLIDYKIDHGLSLDQSLFKEFESKTKHLNFLYVNGVNFIHEFFKLDNKFKNIYSKKIFSFLDNNALFKKYSIMFADRGLR
tara:strand:+ start:244 stop:1338 length:1095 start_codon:yes stop_codon:yes gene_type:complete